MASNNKPKRPMVRKRLNIPEDATDVLAWMDAQTNSDVSIRLLILDFILANGIMDRVNVTNSGTIVNGKAETKKAVAMDLDEAKVTPPIKSELDVLEPMAETKTTDTVRTTPEDSSQGNNMFNIDDIL